MKIVNVVKKKDIKNVSCDLSGLVFRQELRDGIAIILEILAPLLSKRGMRLFMSTAGEAS